MARLWLCAMCVAALAAAARGSALGRVARDVAGKQIDQLVPLLGPREQVDLVLLVDRSRGMEMDNFYLKEKRLLERVLQQYATLADTFVRIACLTFASDVESAFDSISWGTQRINKAELFSGSDPWWGKVKYYYDEARFVETNMELALQSAADIFRDGRERRAGVRQVLLVSTDGDYLRFDDTVGEATQLKDAGVTIFAMGVGPWIAGNAGNVLALVSETGYYAEYSVWVQLLQLQLSNYNPDTTPDLALMDVMPTAEGFCDGGCLEHAQCMVDIDTGVEECMCSAGYTRGTGDQGQPICRPCSLHTYKTTAGNFACRDCASPMYTNTSGNSDPSGCICPVDVVTAGTQHLLCTDQCIDPVDACPGVNQNCLYTGTRTWECECEAGWRNTRPDNTDGVECISSIDDCTVNSCRNGGSCVDLDNAYQCVCAPGFTGPTCLQPQDPCHDDICVNNATCTSTSSIEFSCDCPYGWGGRYCALVSTTPDPTTEAPSTTPGSTTVSSDESKKNDDSLMQWIIIGAAAGGGLLLLVIVIVVVCLCCRRKQPSKEDEVNDAPDGSRLYRKNRANNRTFSNRFSDFWRKKTMTPASFAAGAAKGLPSVPPRRRPDLLGHVDEDGFTTMQSDHEMEYAEFDNQTVEDTGGMEGWQRYVTDIAAGGLVERALIVKVAGRHRAESDAWEWSDGELDKLLALMERGDVNVPLLVQGAEYHVHDNDATLAQAKTIGSSDDPRVMCMGRSKDFLIVGIADASKDSGQCVKEIQWITDHIKNEGY